MPVKSNFSTSLGGLRAKKALILQARIATPGEEIIRDLGIGGDATISDLGKMLSICFGLSESEKSCCCKNDEELIDELRLDCCCQNQGDQLLFTVQRHDIAVRLVDVVDCEDDGMSAMCLGGVGSLYQPFEIADINATLAGGDTMNLIRPEVVDIITDSGIVDFVPLLRALDFSHANPVAPDVAMVCAVLPVEHHPESRTAFWATVLAHSCMCDDELTDRIIESIVRALGWRCTADEVRYNCRTSLRQLSQIGGMRCPVERIDIYRELLRR
ncbi:hypothetical protein CMUST_00590 [Corynebacterium mustelae]|uniref:Uncharacterized protein n=1 Tax=Corynebacterium mustelae TaxID=571915 RepID=A0A0G3GVC1_9CORY|nr:hypothetical protein [Corynebacterium mustelae]AKK04475.1 hypothetical protein CMUST_00590 [Corynebacterium mustelae]